MLYYFFHTYLITERIRRLNLAERFEIRHRLALRPAVARWQPMGRVAVVVGTMQIREETLTYSVSRYYWHCVDYIAIRASGNR